MQLKNTLVIFLAAYMLALILFPCNDTCNSEAHHSIAFQVEHDHHEEEEEEENESCNPFCFCSCCSTSIAFTLSAELGFVPVYFTQEYSLYNQIFISDNHSTFWQPPKLS